MKRKLGVILLLIWALLFLGGAMGEFFEIDALRRTDLKGIFLR